MAETWFTYLRELLGGLLGASPPDLERRRDRSVDLPHARPAPPAPRNDAVQLQLPPATVAPLSGSSAGLARIEEDDLVERWRHAARISIAALLVSGTALSFALGARAAWVKWRAPRGPRRTLTGRRSTSQAPYVLDGAAAGRLASISSDAGASPAYVISEDGVRCDDVVLSVLRRVETVRDSASPLSPAAAAAVGSASARRGHGEVNGKARGATTPIAVDGTASAAPVQRKRTGARHVAVVSRVYLR